MSVLSRITEVWRRQLRFEAYLWIALATFIGYRIWPQVGAAFGVDSGSAVHPSFQLTTLDGRSISSAELRGRVVLVNFWATWCAPCRVEMPGFQAIYDRKRAEGFVVVGISTDAGGPDGVKRFLADRGIDYPVAMAADGVAQRFGGVNVLPTSFLIDREGRIRNEVSGIFASVALEQAVNRLLAEPATGSAKDSARERDDRMRAPGLAPSYVTFVTGMTLDELSTGGQRAARAAASTHSQAFSLVLASWST